MNPSQFRLPEDKAEEVFTLAAQLYAEHSQSYSVEELIAAGTEAKIPPEFVEQAIAQIQLRESSASVSATPVSKPWLMGLAFGLPALLAIAMGGWFLTKNVATNAAVDEPPAVEQVETVQAPPPGESVVAQGNFKCAGLDLQGANLSGESLKGADCTRANLSQANLSGAVLQSANFSQAQLENADLSNANLRGADLAGANLNGADLRGADLQGANLSNSDLRYADLTDAELMGTDLAGADMEGAIK
ncbi:MAG: pentapeptide repeat-containing protein [Coleofasciculaceae cyanobacterium]